MRRLSSLQNRHRGERCVIIGMGPSLRTTDLDRLKGTVAFACNKIFLSFDETDWRPQYYTVSDVLVAENNRDEIDKLDVCKIFPSWVRHRFNRDSDVLWVPVARLKEAFRGAGVGFSMNLTDGIQPCGCTVLYDQLQIAYHMGFAEAVLIGVDFSFTGLKYTGRTCEQGDILIGQGEVNHFHKDYRKPGETWTVPRMEEQRRAFSVARRVYEASGRRILNASRKTALDVLELADFDSVFPG